MSTNLMTGETPSVFLSYSRADILRIRSLAQVLSSAGFRTWLDENDIVGGEWWKSAIPARIGDVDFFMPCLSPEAVSNEGFFYKELMLAINRRDLLPPSHIFVVPVMIQPCGFPTQLGIDQHHLINAFDDDDFIKVARNLWSAVAKNKTLRNQLISPSTTNSLREVSGDLPLNASLSDSLTATIRAGLSRPLDAGIRKCDQLARWLGGFGLPLRPDDDEPYYWIFDVYTNEVQNSERQLRIRDCLAHLLDSNYTRPRRREIGDRLAYNIFRACELVRSPKVIGPILVGIADGKPRFIDWEGIDIGQCFTAALISNQVDARFFEDWMWLLSGRVHDVFRGGIREGFLGVALMPGSTEHVDGAGPPIERAFDIMVSSYSRFDDRNDRAVGLLRDVRDLSNDEDGVKRWILHASERLSPALRPILS